MGIGRSGGGVGRKSQDRTHRTGDKGDLSAALRETISRNAQRKTPSHSLDKPSPDMSYQPYSSYSRLTFSRISILSKFLKNFTIF
jgi:hypothetical protein